jgi:hypothetical protein
MGMADNFISVLNGVLRRDFDKLGKEIVQETRELISVRVERRRGKIIRSKRGEPPRFDSGELYRSINYEVDIDDLGNPTLLVYCHQKGLWLEENLDRPFLTTVTHRHVDELGDDFLVLYG